MKWSWLVFLAACVPQFAVIPSGGQPRLTGQGAGASLTAVADPWTGEPYDLADYVTPLAIELANDGPNELRVSFVDFALTDEHGTRFAAVSPFIPDALSSLDLRRGALYASRGGGGGHGGGGRGGGGGRSVGAPSGSRGGGRSVGSPSGSRGFSGQGRGGGGFGGYRISGGLRGWYGPGVPYFGGGFGLGPWVVLWSPGLYAGPPSHDVLLSALPEGVLPPGTRVFGYLYFQKATQPDTHRLDLAWHLHDANSSADLGSLHVPFDVVERR